jgi:hypothetical protein
MQEISLAEIFSEENDGEYQQPPPKKSTMETGF